MSSAIRAASVADHTLDAPQGLEADGSPTWITRAANMVVAVTRARPGCRLRTLALADEHMALLPEVGAEVHAGDARRQVGPRHLVIAPPGDTELVVGGEGWVFRCFSARNRELLERAGNAAAYPEPPHDTAPLRDWPEPVGGFALRVYDLDEGLQAGDKTRCYRSANLMINVLRERDAPRDTATLSPHAHDDFEQVSISLRGKHIHHLRTPWGADLDHWSPDVAIEVGSPSVVVIPPRMIHTTRNTSPGALVDLFCPPRRDFALRPGMVRNAADYPFPEALATTG